MPHIPKNHTEPPEFPLAVVMEEMSLRLIEPHLFFRAL